MRLAAATACLASLFLAAFAVSHGKRHAALPHGAWAHRQASILQQEAGRGVWRRRRLAATGVLMLSFAASPPGASAKGMSFDFMDGNGDGIVDREEYMLSARDSLHSGEPRDKNFRRSVYRFVGRLYDNIDLDGDGVLSRSEIEFGEFLAASAVHEPMDGVGDDGDDGSDEFGGRRAKQLMRILDMNSDGAICRDEFDVAFKHAFAPLGWTEETFAAPRVRMVADLLFNKSDVSKDGFLSARELQYGAFLLNGYAVAETTASMFRDLDTRREGRIGREAVTAARRLAKPNLRPGEASVADIIDENFEDFDEDSDGALDVQEAERLATRVLQELHLQGD